MRALLKDTFRYFISAWFPLASFFLMLFLVTPATVFYYNASELTDAYWQGTSYFICLFFLSSCALFLLSGLLRRRIHCVAAVFSIFTVYIFVVNFFFPSITGFLDELKPVTPLMKDKIFYIDLALFSVISLLCYFRFALIKKMSMSATVISLVFVAYVFVSVNVEHSGDNDLTGNINNPYFEFSRNQNIIVLSFDSIEGDVLSAVLAQHPGLLKPLDGFRYYTDVASFAPNTTFSLPTTLRGKMFATGKKGAHIEGIAKDANQLMISTVLRKNGYEVSLFPLYNSIYHAHGDGQGNYASPKMILGDSPSLDRGLLNAFQFTVMRLLPADIALHAFIGNKLLWLMFDKSSHYLSFKALEGNIVLIDKPVFKFYHYLIPHDPLMFDEQCRYNVITPLDDTFENAKAEAVCVMSLLDDFISALKKLDIYDNSLIIITSDHGHTSFGQSAESMTKVNRWTASRYWPILLMKPENSHGEMMADNSPISLLDIAPTICDAALDKKQCDSYDYDGLNLLGAPVPSDRKRAIMVYTTKHDDEATGQRDSRLYETGFFCGNAMENIPRLMQYYIP